MNNPTAEKLASDLKVLGNDAEDLLKTAINEGRARVHDLRQFMDKVCRRPEPRLAWFRGSREAEAATGVNSIALLSAAIFIGIGAMLVAGQYRR